MKRFYLVFSILQLTISVFAATPQELFEQANAAYAKGQYQQAIESYEAILAQGAISAEVYYNLGNGEFHYELITLPLITSNSILNLKLEDFDNNGLIDVLLYIESSWSLFKQTNLGEFSNQIPLGFNHFYGGDIAFKDIDLDGLKTANDQWGHETGDNILRDAANRLRDVVRKSDCIGRLGGDEFLIIAECNEHSLTILANQAAAAIAHTRLYQKERARAAHLELVGQIGREIGRSQNLQELFDLVVKLTQETFNFHLVSIFQINEEESVKAIGFS